MEEEEQEEEDCNPIYAESQAEALADSLLVTYKLARGLRVGLDQVSHFLKMNFFYLLLLFKLVQKRARSHGRV